MEYYLFVTRNCNLKCTYCSGVNLVRGTNIAANSLIDVKQVAKFVLNNKKSNEPDTVVFYGGEPLLNQNIIKEFIELTKDNEIKYVLQTNSILLDKIDQYILDNLDYLFISIDGEHRTHNKYRGRGTYEKVIENYFKVKPQFKGKTLARLTIGSDSSLYRAVLSVVSWFDYVYWQLCSPDFEKLETFKESYSKDLDLLLDFWIGNLKDGILKHIIPFEAIVTSILLNRKCEGFRCDCGSSLIAIDIDGKCYVCDELRDSGEKFLLGDIYSGIKQPRIVKSRLYKKYCENCSIKYICGGNCYKDSWQASTQEFLFYCDTTKMLVEKIRKKLPLIQKLIDDNIIKLENLDLYFKEGIAVEEIP